MSFQARPGRRAVAALALTLVSTASRAAAQTEPSAPPVAEPGPDAPPVPAVDRPVPAPAVEPGPPEPTDEPPADEVVGEEVRSVEDDVDAGGADELPRAPVLAEGVTGIEGRLVDARTGDPIVEGTILLDGPEGLSLRAYTDLDGRYAVEVPAGLFRVRAYADFYREVQHRPVRVRAGQHLEVDLRLREADDEHIVIEVVEQADRRSEAALAQERMSSTVAADSIGQATVTQNPNAARAAARVVGASVDGSTLVIRGLGDRYVSVLMNGVFLPGTDPDRNGVQLDVIPSAIVANLSAVKTFQPELPANFAGGLLLIESPSTPDDLEVRASASIGFNSRATFRRTYSYDGEAGDAFGFGLRGRALPGAVPDFVVRTGTRLDDGTRVTDVMVEPVGESFRDRWAIGRSRETPNGTFSFSIGDSFDLRRGRRVGFITGLNYTRSASVRSTVTRLLATDTVLASDFLSDQTNEETLLTGFFTGTFRYDGGDLRLLSMFTQHASDLAQFQSGAENENNAYVERWQLQYVQRQVAFEQLVGQHRGIPWWGGREAHVDYSVYVAHSRRDEPDTRQVRYEREDDQPGDPLNFVDSPNGGDILVFDLDQTDGGGYGHLSFPLFQEEAGVLEGEAQIGFDARVSSRTSTFRDFHFLPYLTDAAFQSQPIETVLDPANLNNLAGPIRFRENAFPQNNYDARLFWFGAFATTDFRLGRHTRVAGGVRLESMTREVELAEVLEGFTYDDNVPRSVRRSALDVLPGATVILTPRERMNVRLAYGMTVVHPQFREFAPVNYYDFARRRNINGNVDLRRTHVHNLDVRWEWLTDEQGGIIAVSAFYKRFLDPIERANTGKSSRDLLFVNADAAYNVGAEFEARIGLGRWDDVDNWLDWFAINGNLALVYSRVTLAAERADAQPSRTRPMFLQSPYVANLSLSFDHPDSGLSMTLSYNSVGSRIVEVGSVNSMSIIPNVIERPFHSLDLVGNYPINEHIRFNWTIRNMLSWQRSMTQGTYLTERYDPGTEISVGVRYSN